MGGSVRSVRVALVWVGSVPSPLNRLISISDGWWFCELENRDHVWSVSTGARKSTSS